MRHFFLNLKNYLQYYYSSLDTKYLTFSFNFQFLSKNGSLLHNIYFLGSCNLQKLKTVYIFSYLAEYLAKRTVTGYGMCSQQMTKTNWEVNIIYNHEQLSCETSYMKKMRNFYGNNGFKL